MNGYNRLSSGDRIYIGFAYTVLSILLAITLYPFWDLLVLSVCPRNESMRTGLHLYTLNPNFVAYIQIFESPDIMNAFFNSIKRVVFGTGLCLFFSSLMAYPLSKKDLPLNKTITVIILFTMMFGGGMIPTYLLYKSLHLIDNSLVLVLPAAVNAYFLIIMRNFTRTIPDSLVEAAKMDGAMEFFIWCRIILPLSMPVLATIALWSAVDHWNAYFDALIYITDRKKYVLQIILRKILIDNSAIGLLKATGRRVVPTDETSKAAIMIVSTVPIMAVYPFLQKYFISGIVLGSVKE